MIFFRSDKLLKDDFNTFSYTNKLTTEELLDETIFYFAELDTNISNIEYTLKIVSLPSDLIKFQEKYPSLFNISDNSFVQNDILYFNENSNNPENSPLNLTGYSDNYGNISISYPFLKYNETDSSKLLNDIFINPSMQNNEKQEIMLFVNKTRFYNIFKYTNSPITGIVLFNINEQAIANFKHFTKIEDFLISPNDFNNNIRHSEIIYQKFYFKDGLHSYFTNEYHILKFEKIFSLVFLFILCSFLYYHYLKHGFKRFLYDNDETIKTLILFGDDLKTRNTNFRSILISKFLLIILIGLPVILFGLNLILYLIVFNNFALGNILYFLIFNLIFIIPLILLILIAFKLVYNDEFLHIQLTAAISYEKKKKIKSLSKPFLIMILFLICLYIIESEIQKKNIEDLNFIESNLILYFSILFLSFLFIYHISDRLIIFLNQMNIKINEIIVRKEKFKKIIGLLKKRKNVLSFNKSILFFVLFTSSIFSFIIIQNDYFMDQHNSYVKDDFRISIEMDHFNESIEIENIFNSYNFQNISYVYQLDLFENNVKTYIPITYISDPFTISNSDKIRFPDIFQSSNGAIINSRSQNIPESQNYLNFNYNQSDNITENSMPILYRNRNLDGFFSDLKNYQDSSIVIWGNSSTFLKTNCSRMIIFIKSENLVLNETKNQISKIESLINSSFVQILEKNSYSFNVLKFSLLDYIYPLTIIAFIIFSIQIVEFKNKEMKKFEEDTINPLAILGMTKKKIRNLKSVVDFLFVDWILLFIIIASIIISNICLNMITIKIYTNIRFPFAFIINKNL
ncbi:MAG: hypothetical protein ACTSWX_14285, partial [Promethearchaeota archaeon]